MVEKVRFGSTGLNVTKVAFGGIPIMRLTKSEGVRVIKDVLKMGVNFIDTAYVYGDSEEKIGEAIQGFSRDKLIIASKSMAQDRETFLKHLDKGLKRLRTDYIDIYHMHGVNSEEEMKRVMEQDGAMEGLKRAIEAGKVRYPAFSSHNLTVAKKMMLTGEFQVVQFPFNFVDTEAREELIPLAGKLNMGFICMKPLGGGLLSDANLCIRYLMQFKHIVPDPGIEKSEEMAEILTIIQTPRPLLENEKARIEEIRKEMGVSWCHRCDYCQPCPQDIKISSVLIAKSIVKRMPYGIACSFLEPAMEKARECTQCQECVEKCPYNLNIPELLRKNLLIWKKYKKIRTATVFD